MIKLFSAAIAVALLSFSAAHADDVCADRPSKSSNPCTTPVGTFQLESDLFNGSYLRQGGVTTDFTTGPNPTLKYGVTSTLDVEVNMALYEDLRVHSRAGTTDTSGIGDLYVRVKDKLPDFYGWQVSVVPYVKIPTAHGNLGNDEVEYGASTAIQHQFGPWTVTTNPEVDILKNANNHNEHAQFQDVFNVGYQLTPKVNVSGELWGLYDFEPIGGVQQYSADIAASYLIASDLSVDGGLNFGLNKQTPGVQVYAGFSKRF
jgi:hypothetical protein